MFLDILSEFFLWPTEQLIIPTREKFPTAIVSQML